jgi:NAD(P)-dependent dehydrogenase (short-subunit alcohol dehydrogenase family)
MKRLEGRIAIVTGAAGGIGAATVCRFVQEGALVIAADIFEEGAREAVSELNERAFAMKVDMADVASVDTMIRSTVVKFGRLDILHNNAALQDPAVMNKDTSAPEIPLEVWDATFRVNLKGYLLACKFAIPQMLRQGGGVIINTTSTSGLSADNNLIAYSASKAGVISLTRTIALQHGRQHIRCNAIAPGLILTPRAQQSPKGYLEMIAKHVLTPRLGKSTDIAALAAFLASDDAEFITGQTISCDGGYLIHQPHYSDFNAWVSANHSG